MKIFKRIGLIALAICVGIGSLFITMPQKSNKYASADYFENDANSIFLSSDIIFTRLGNVNTVPSYGYVDDFSWFLSTANHGGVYDNTMQWFSYSFKFEKTGNFSIISLSAYHYGFGTNSGYGVYNINTGVIDYISVYNNSLTGVNITNSLNDANSIYFSALLSAPVRTSSGSRVTSFGFGIGVNDNYIDNTNPTFNMYKVAIGSDISPEFSYLMNDLRFSNYTNSTIVRYTDTAEIEYYFFIPNWTAHSTNSVDDNSYYSFREYFLSANFNFTNNAYYNQGYSDGQSTGLTLGYDNGYAEGSTEGYQQGFQAGRVDGIESAGEYTFLGLIGAVVDAPVSVFKTMFNFNLLGVNMRDFFLALLTFSFILVAVKFIFMRK